MEHVMGCDPHLDRFDAAVVNQLGRRVAQLRRDNTTQGWADAVRLARRFGVATVGIEAASGYGRSLAQAMTNAGIGVVEIPTRVTAHGRKTDGGGKSDAGDARVVARAVLAGEGSTWADDPDAEALRVVVHRRRALVAAQTRDVNHLRALLAEIDPERAAALPRLRSTRAFTTLSRVRYGGDTHRQEAAALIRAAAADCRRRLDQIRRLTRRISELLPTRGWRLVNTIDGVGVIGAATICAETAGTDGFATAAKFAKWAGIAPLDASSGRQERHRLNRGGNRQVNAAIHAAVLTQHRQGGPAAHYISRRRREGKTQREAIRALKRHLARRIWKTLNLT